MKYEETASSLKHTWHHVVGTFYKRYPNAHSRHVLSEDVVYRKLEGDVLRTVRLYKKTNETPNWLSRILPTASAIILEESCVDLSGKTLYTYSENISLNTFLLVCEKSTFTVHDENKEWTEIQRNAQISSGFYGLSYAFERFGVSRYRSNIQRMDRGFDSVLKNRPVECSQRLNFTNYALPNTA